MKIRDTENKFEKKMGQRKMLMKIPDETFEFRPTAMRRLKFRRACKLMDMDHRSFRKWCLRHDVTIHPGIGGSFVLWDDLELGCKRQVEAGMKKKLGEQWEKVLLEHNTTPAASSHMIAQVKNTDRSSTTIKLSREAQKFDDYVKRKEKEIFRNAWTK